MGDLLGEFTRGQRNELAGNIVSGLIEEVRARMGYNPVDLSIYGPTGKTAILIIILTS